MEDTPVPAYLGSPGKWPLNKCHLGVDNQASTISVITSPIQFMTSTENPDIAEPYMPMEIISETSSRNYALICSLTDNDTNAVQCAQIRNQEHNIFCAEQSDY